MLFNFVDTCRYNMTFQTTFTLLAEIHQVTVTIHSLGTTLQGSILNSQDPEYKDVFSIEAYTRKTIGTNFLDRLGKNL